MRARLDAVFSLYIRARDCEDGKGRCISCGAKITPSTCDCGHFIPRTHTATRFDERNCAAQCYTCNRYQDGNEEGFARGLIARYGEGIIDELKQRSRQIVKLSKSDYQELTKHYNHEIAIRQRLHGNNPTTTDGQPSQRVRYQDSE